MKRHGLNQRPVEDKSAPITHKTFKDYAPGFVHIDIKYLPQMADESTRRYLFVAIGRATRWAYVHIYADQSEASSTDFPRPPAAWSSASTAASVTSWPPRAFALARICKRPLNAI
jgi:hypothetical protein